MKFDNYDNLFNECSEFIELLSKCRKGTFLIRGSNYRLADEWFSKITPNLDFRKPLNMPLDIHDSINDKYSNIFGWKVRNGVFCYGYNMIVELEYNCGYSYTYLVFPVNGYKYVFSPNVFDMVYELEKSRMKKEDFISWINYVDEGLENVIDIPIYEGRSCEIMLKCDQYYLVDKNQLEYLIEKIWKSI